MYPRKMAGRLKWLATKYPVVTVTGPRQSGKTTLVCQTFPDKAYANLEELDIRALAEQDPREFLKRYPDGAILDEIQLAPQLLSYIQVLVDQADREGMFILTGSHELQLHQSITQSLAGRTALLQLLPMSLDELQEAGIELTLEEALLTGGYPRIYRKQLEPAQTYRDYVQTYLERDLRHLVNIKELGLFQRFLGLLVGRIGQLLNASSLADDVGVSSPTIKQWLSILEASYLIIQLRPYFENFGKRIVKSPKVYFTDVGLASYLLGIETPQQLRRDPLYGSLFENLVLLELMKERLNEGRDPRLYFFRDIAGHEVDFIYQSGHELIPIEVKGGQTFNREFLKAPTYFQKLIGERSKAGFVIYAGEQEQKVGSLELLNYRRAAQAIGRFS
ncbi:MAG: ATP-binding protein [Parachlamydiales bacterium]